MAKEKKSSKNIIADPNEAKFRIYASLSFMTVVILIGVPMWWKTTEVYRVSLPYSEIKLLGSSPLKISQTIGIYAKDPSRSSFLIKELEEYVTEMDFWNITFEQIVNVERIDSAKTPAAAEALILKKFIMKPGDFLFFEWPKLMEDILLTDERSAMITENTSASKVKQVLNLYVLQSHRIRDIIDDKSHLAHKSSSPQPQYDVLISVLNPRPDLVDLKWNVKLASNMYLAPFLEEISYLSNYTLKTQWRYQAPFEFPLKQVQDDSPIGRHYALSQGNLPHMITSIEKYLGQSISDHSVIHIVVYVPPCDISPLHIYDSNEKKLSGNDVVSFISPKWGGIIIYNPPEQICKQYHENPSQITVKVDSKNVMQIALFQLQKLLDLSADVHIDGVDMVEIEKLSPRTWEFEAYIRRSIVQQLLSATRTLQSLIALLDNISYIVINDDVGDSINVAYKEILKAKELLRNNNLMEAAATAKRAFISSERAFFDPTLLAQLYFPDEQKYAIYIPLFLPIMVPVITSLTTIYSFYTHKPKKE